MAIFHSYVSHYQRVVLCFNPPSAVGVFSPSQRDPVGSVGLLQFADADGVCHHLRIDGDQIGHLKKKNKK